MKTERKSIRVLVPKANRQQVIFLTEIMSSGTRDKSKVTVPYAEIREKVLKDPHTKEWALQTGVLVPLHLLDDAIAGFQELRAEAVKRGLLEPNEPAELAS